MPCHMSQCDRNTLTAKFIIFDVSCSQLSPLHAILQRAYPRTPLNNGVSKFAEEHIELVQALTLPTPRTPRATSDTRHILSRNRFLILLRIHTTIVDYALRIQQTHWTVLIGHFYCGKAHRIQTDVNSYPVTLPRIKHLSP